MPNPIALNETLQLTLYSVNRSPYSTLDLHEVSVPAWVLSFVQDGDLLTRTLDQTWQVSTGDVMLHPPSIPFSETATRPGVHLWLAFDATLGSHIDMFRVHPIYPVVKILEVARYEQVFNTLRTVWNGAETATRTFRTVALTIALFDMVLTGWEHMHSLPRPLTMQTTADRFTDVIRYMTAHLTEKLTRQELAAQVHLHPAYFDQLFRETYGTPPMKMLRDLRLRHAQALLQSTDQPLAALAEQCGLGDAAYLNRVFLKKFGQTPGAYRKAVKSTKTAYIPALPEKPSPP